MTISHLQSSTDLHPNLIRKNSRRSTIGNYLRELTNYRVTKFQLREALAREEILLRKKNDFIKQQAVLSEESDHRLLNGLQIISSLLSMQSRVAPNAEAASQLDAAASRVGMIGRVHRRLHSLDGVKTIAFKPYLEDFCRDFSAMAFAPERPEDSIVVEAIEIELPTVTAIPLGFIVNELLTNAIKYGRGRIMVRLEPGREKGYALSVSNDGPVLPEGFVPASSRGLGMRIIRSFVQRVDGELRIGRGDGNQGARFTVLFP